MPKPTLTETKSFKNDFPFFQGRSIHYLDSAATTHKPKSVIDAMNKFYSESYSTVRRGVYQLSAQATQTYEATRKKTAQLLGATSENEIIFTSGTTQSINLVAYSYARKFIKAGDEILVSAMEHHANIVPWQLACEETGAHLKVIPMNDQGELLLDEYQKLLSSKTKLVAVNYVSNALGTINPLKEMTQMAHQVGARILVDGAQSTSHLQINVAELDIDFYAFSGHKIYGPTGIGILYGKKELLEQMPPYQSGGDMIENVTFEKTTFLPPPHRFEAGTPAVAEIIGLNAALDYLNSVGLETIAQHEAQLLEYGTQKLQSIDGLTLMGTAKKKAGILAFTIKNIHPHDIATLLDESHVIIRSGHHCAQPIMQRFGVNATARASLGLYNSFEDLDALVDGLERVKRIFG